MKSLHLERRGGLFGSAGSRAVSSAARELPVRRLSEEMDYFTEYDTVTVLFL